MGAAGHALTHLQTMDCHHVSRLAAEAQRPESTRVNHRLANDGIDCSRESIQAAFVDGLRGPNPLGCTSIEEGRRNPLRRPSSVSVLSPPLKQLRVLSSKGCRNSTCSSSLSQVDPMHRGFSARFFSRPRDPLCHHRHPALPLLRQRSLSFHHLKKSTSSRQLGER